MLYKKRKKNPLSIDNPVLLASILNVCIQGHHRVGKQAAIEQISAAATAINSKHRTTGGFLVPSVTRQTPAVIDPSPAVILPAADVADSRRDVDRASATLSDPLLDDVDMLGTGSLLRTENQLRTGCHVSLEIALLLFQF